MNILIDTHILLWHLTDNPRLSLAQSRIIEDPTHVKFFSVASLWEMAIKSSLGKLDLRRPMDELVPPEISVLPIRLSHLKTLQSLPFHHKDPFDRLLVAQAQVESLWLMTDDENISKYILNLL
jgi:PIN domain nuclease of toxin-antitoxin system